MERNRITIFIILIIVLALGIIYVPKMSGYIIKGDTGMTKVKLTTNHGEIIIEL